MKQFDISRPNQSIYPEVVFHINDLTKPKGSLGVLESLAEQICMVQQTLSPKLDKPVNILFGADHGIEVEGVSFSPRCITWQQMIHFSKGGAGVNFLCNQHHFGLRLVDGGVDYDFPSDLGIINRKVRKGTSNYLYEPAMSMDEVDRCLRIGAEEVDAVYNQGTNIISIGEMGIANTSASSLWMSCITDMDIATCVGAGSGLDSQGVAHKLDVLTRAQKRFEGNRHDPYALMSEFGGFEMVMAVGAMLRAAELKMLILIDGFIMTSCILMARAIAPEVMEYAIFGHEGDEVGHKILIDYLGVRPLLHLGFRLGEGTGAICAYPIVQSAVCMVNNMDTFSAASVQKYY
ncbi:MAG: nicotinate-nucleotide--dimethylbenzimidazole phosphoribosyltransferase [Porphyromonadaceae bacterium]|nr:nicotinate-nucleotide--dimethylbenzimidazole phosphoribosyltransferase [Porphyromonadaceae bacterium]